MSIHFIIFVENNNKYLLAIKNTSMELIKEFENLTQLNKYEKENKDNLKIDNIDYNYTTEMWIVTFIAKIPINNINKNNNNEI